MISVMPAVMLASGLAARSQAEPQIDPDLTGAGPKQGKERMVEPELLLSSLSAADRVVVLDTPFKDSAVLFSSSKKNDLDELRVALVVVRPDSWFHCMCMGAPAIELYKGTERLATVTVHHGRSIRTSLWDSDAMLSDPERLLRWFDARGIDGPRREVEEAKANTERSMAAERRWLAAMPQSLRPLWDASRAGILRSPMAPDLEPWRVALKRQYPDPAKRILALLTWFGSGEGPWSGFPSYESMAEELLLDFSTGVLLDAVTHAPLEATQLEGAARLFGGWDFSSRRPNDLDMLPENLRAALLQHSLRTEDDDKRARAQRAFGK